MVACLWRRQTSISAGIAACLLVLVYVFLLLLLAFSTSPISDILPWHLHLLYVACCGSFLNLLQAGWCTLARLLTQLLPQSLSFSVFSSYYTSQTERASWRWGFLPCTHFYSAWAQFSHWRALFTFYTPYLLFSDTHNERKEKLIKPMGSYCRLLSLILFSAQSYYSCHWDALPHRLSPTDFWGLIAYAFCVKRIYV